MKKPHLEIIETSRTTPMKTITFRVGEDQLRELRGGRIAIVKTDGAGEITMEWKCAVPNPQKAGDKPFVRKTMLFGRIAAIAAALAMMAGSAFADTFRVSYTLNGAGKQITVQARSTQDARNTVEDIFPGCYVTGAFRVGK